MIDEPNSHNQHHPGDLGADTSPWSAEVDALARRLIADGDFWRSRLPDSARVIERVRAIPHESLLSTSEGGFQVFEDDGGSYGNTRPVAPYRPPRSSSFLSRLSSLAAVAVVLALIGTVAVVFYSTRGNPPGGTSSPTATATSTAASAAAFQVSKVTMSVNPVSISGMACGTTTTVTYTAVFQVPANTQGGTVKFNYTVNNGRGTNPASLTFSPGQTTQSYTFTWSGALPADHTYPGQGGVQVTSPNQYTSQLVAPTGQCTPLTAPTCGPNFSSSISQNYVSTLTTDFGTVPLPPLSRTVPNDAAGGVRGYDICSAGTASTIIMFMEQNLPSHGWTLVSKSGSQESWKSSSGQINWSVTDPLQWNINWRVAA
ncbi:MAG: hypothetical protein C5B60_09045 [Chloroflexi bacterium]|nr:MAG: hypothetical protein C5B60_09045 [Chloroflexota bacterium]